MVGDSTWDCIAAERAGVPTVGLLTGGFSGRSCCEAGARCVYESIGELIERLARDSPCRGLSEPPGASPARNTPRK